MDKIKYLIIINIIWIFISCEKVNDPDLQSGLSAGMPGENLVDMELDNNNVFYFVSMEIDKSIEKPVWSSSFPAKFYLSQRKSENGEFEILDNDFVHVDEILFDKDNNLWSRNSKKIYLRKDQSIITVLELPGDKGLFQFMAVDNDNNIWAGGLTTGLYKIDSELNIQHFDKENSSLPGISMTNIHIDKYNNIWIALWDNQGVLKINGDNWTVYNSSNSNITSQNIWCLVTDKNDELWIGTGHDNKEIALLKFDDQNWIVENPKNRTETVYGTVRKLYSDTNRIYIISEQVKNMAFDKNFLLTFDGLSWNKIDEVPEDDVIADVKIDYARNVAWIRTFNKGIFKLSL